MVNLTVPVPTPPVWLYLARLVSRFDVVSPETFCHMILDIGRSDVIEAVKVTSDPYNTLLDDNDRTMEMVPEKVY